MVGACCFVRHSGIIALNVLWIVFGNCVWWGTCVLCANDKILLFIVTIHFVVFAAFGQCVRVLIERAYESCVQVLSSLGVHRTESHMQIDKNAFWFVEKPKCWEFAFESEVGLESPFWIFRLVHLHLVGLIRASHCSYIQAHTHTHTSTYACLRTCMCVFVCLRVWACVRSSIACMYDTFQKSHNPKCKAPYKAYRFGGKCRFNTSDNKKWCARYANYLMRKNNNNAPIHL